MSGSEPVLRAVCTLIGGGFLLYSFISAMTGSFFDSDDGWRSPTENAPTGAGTTVKVARRTYPSAA
jgi:hypothetical protein